jgi:hypothetical protein
LVAGVQAIDCADLTFKMRQALNLLEDEVVDATHLQLSQPITLERGRKVYISMEETEKGVSDRQQWHAVSASGLQFAYGEGEPDYSSALVNYSNTIR